MSRKLRNVSNPIYDKGKFQGVDSGLTNATRAYLSTLDYYRTLAVDNQDLVVAELLDEIRDKFANSYNKLREQNIEQLRIYELMQKEAKEQRKQERLKEKENGIE
jgi:hypothetical protein